MWDEETEEAENDVAGLMLSFLNCQMLRYYWGGWLPNSEGEDPDGAEVGLNSSQVRGLVFCGLAFAVLTVVVLVVKRKMNFEEESLGLRISEVGSNFASMGFAWCFYYGSHWGFMVYFGAGVDETLVRVMLALFVSFASFVCIFGLDKIADSEATVKEVDDAIISIIGAFGILVGFGWEQSFDVAVTSISSRVGGFCNPAIFKLLLAGLLVLIVLPAWRFYVLPTVARLVEAKEEEGHHDLFARIDADEDGIVTRDQFVEFFTKGGQSPQSPGYQPPKPV